MDELPGKTAASTSFWESRDDVTPEFVMDVTAGLSIIDEMLAERAVQHFFAWPGRYGMDQILVPALRSTWKKRLQ